jgi:uncharacterized membrane protein
VAGAGQQGVDTAPDRQAALSAAEQATQPEDLERSDKDEELRYKQATRRHRDNYANWLLCLLVGQVVVTNAVFVLDGLHVMCFDPVTLRIFVGATIGEIVALVMIIVRHLFPLQKG